ncbi:Glucose-methanol-choline oxidoreductase [Gracilaria domingensis]|nr:Glucose-methanol-choline oxidoreductase [Gracilaria domingensis]
MCQCIKARDARGYFLRSHATARERSQRRAAALVRELRDGAPNARRRARRAAAVAAARGRRAAGHGRAHRRRGHRRLRAGRAPVRRAPAAALHAGGARAAARRRRRLRRARAAARHHRRRRRAAVRALPRRAGAGAGAARARRRGRRHPGRRHRRQRHAVGRAARLRADGRQIYADDLFEAAAKARFEPENSFAARHRSAARLAFRNPLAANATCARQHPCTSNLCDEQDAFGVDPRFGSASFDRTARKTIFNTRLAINSSGVRQDSCTAYLSPVRDSVCANNLRVVQGVTITRIRFTREHDGRALRARGAEYVYTNRTAATDHMFVHVRKRIISAAGPFNSPKLLQLSGIGPRRVLRQARIPVLKHLPVGTRAQARPLVGVFSSYSDRIPLEPQGNYTLINSADEIARWRGGEASPLGAPVGSVVGRVARDGYFISSFFVLPAFRPPGAQNMSRLLSTVCLGNPTSFGSVQVRDSNPFTPPKVHLNMLSSRKEIAQMTRCLKSMVEIHNRFDPRFDLSFVAPKDGRITLQYIQQSASFALHHVGACSVGSTLDGKLKVKGTSNLYVVDASSLRRMTTSAGPMASVYMLAEFAAERFATELGV